MFSLFASQESKMRRHAANWLEVSEKVWNFRRDRMTGAETAELTSRTDELRQQLKDRADAGKLKLSIEALEGVLRKTGGAIYPQTTIGEYVEFFLVAAIVILGFRTYFIQPFKIPTNSMWPTYYGMTAENILPTEAGPSTLTRMIRLVAFGAQRREVSAPADGEVSALFTNTGALAYTVKADRTWLVFPTTVREYTFYVNGEPATVRVPMDFNREFDRVFQETFFGNESGFIAYLNNKDHKVEPVNNGSSRVFKIALGRLAKKGDLLLRFDILTGDNLFVDRFSYHFFKPKVGQGFVFRTDNIHSPHMADRETGGQIQQYYIKRLVGTPGDVLEQKTPALYRNGQPITGAQPFNWNATKTGLYRGYGFSGFGPVYLETGKTVTVPAHSFFAMGDNSYESSDSRFWGFVPEADVIGRPLFIYYPFTKRWGLSK